MPHSIRIRLGDQVHDFDLSQQPNALLETDGYKEWISGIADKATKARIFKDVGKMRRGLFGDWKSVGEGVLETRLDYGPGYRVYYAKFEEVVIVLLVGGDKGSQKTDIEKAQDLWKEIKNEIAQV